MSRTGQCFDLRNNVSRRSSASRSSTVPGLWLVFSTSLCMLDQTQASTTRRAFGPSHSPHRVSTGPDRTCLSCALWQQDAANGRIPWSCSRSHASRSILRAKAQCLEVRGATWRSRLQYLKGKWYPLSIRLRWGELRDQLPTPERWDVGRPAPCVCGRHQGLPSGGGHESSYSPTSQLLQDRLGGRLDKCLSSGWGNEWDWRDFPSSKANLPAWSQFCVFFRSLRLLLSFHSFNSSHNYLVSSCWQD